MVAIVVLVCVFFFLSIELIGLLLKKEKEDVQPIAVRPFADVHLPRGLFVGKGHGWTKLMESGELRLGIDEFLAQAIGGADRVELAETGHKVSKGQTIATIWRSGRKIEIPSPVNGTIVTTNEKVKGTPTTLTNDPYGRGWLATVWPVEHSEALKNLRVGDKAVAWMENEVQRFVEFLAMKTGPELVGATLPDGARPVVGSALILDEDGLLEFQKEFAHETAS